MQERQEKSMVAPIDTKYPAILPNVQRYVSCSSREAMIMSREQIHTKLLIGNHENSNEEKRIPSVVSRPPRHQQPTIQSNY
jgi:hypothetical protein